MSEFSKESVLKRQAALDTLPISMAEFVIMIAALMALNALAIDVMLPALDDIGTELGADGNRQQLIVYVYILGFGAPQLVFGPLTDRFGRRPVLFISLIGYALAGLVCMFAQDFSQLLVARFIQGVFAAGCRVIAVSVVRDVFEGRGMAKIMSLVMTIFMVVPILAPSIGQGILFIAPWEWVFGTLTVAAIIVLVWTVFRLPETLSPDAHMPLDPQSMLRAYGQILRTPVTLGYMCASGVIFGSLFAFIGSAEQIFSEVFDQEETFPLWFAGVAFMLSVANFTNSRLVERLGMRRLSHCAMVGFTATSLLLVLAMTVFGESLSIFFPLFVIIFACFGLIGPNINALAMEPLGKIAGTASAAMGFASTTVAGFIGWAVGSQYNGSAIPVIWGFFLLGFATLIIVLITERGRLFSSR